MTCSGGSSDTRTAVNDDVKETDDHCTVDELVQLGRVAEECGEGKNRLVSSQCDGDLVMTGYTGPADGGPQLMVEPEVGDVMAWSRRLMYSRS